MSTERLISLESWARARYGEDMPTVATLRRWAREAKIYPAPQKHGRSYFVSDRARYVTNYRDIAKVERESATAQH
jgi:hypothetical protein